MKKVIMAVFLVFMLFGCASLPKHMTVSTNPNITNDYKNAKIIFLDLVIIFPQVLDLLKLMKLKITT